MGAFQSQDFEAVEKLSHSMTKSFPLHPFAWKALSAALRNNKKYDEAIKAHKKNIELSPKDPEAYNNFGNYVAISDDGLTIAVASEYGSDLLDSDYSNNNYHYMSFLKLFLISFQF